MTKGALSFPRLLALTLGLVVIERAVLFRMAVGPLLGISSSGAVLVVVWLWLLLAASAIVGLAVHRRWGGYALLLLVPFSTVMMSIPLVPLVVRLAPVSYRPYLMIVVNVLVLLATLIVMRRLPASSATGSAGSIGARASRDLR